jgi:hypothetical protein
MTIRPYKARDLARSALLTAVRNRRSGPCRAPLKGTTRPCARGSGFACESDGDDSEVRVRLRAAGGAKHPRLGPRSGNFAGFKGSRGQFHEKIGASFYNPNRPESSCFLSDVFLACMYGARGRHHTVHKWSLGQRPVLSAWKHAPFSKKMSNENKFPLKKSKIAPKWGVRTRGVFFCLGGPEHEVGR